MKLSNKEIINSSVFVAVDQFLKAAKAAGIKPNHLSAYAFALAGGEKLLDEENADVWLNVHYARLGIDYEYDAELDCILEKYNDAMQALLKGEITVNYR